MARSFVFTVLFFITLGPAQIWTARYNGSGDSLDGAAAVAVDAAGNVYVTGRSMAPNFGYDYVTVKYNAAGGQRWTARYDGPVSSYDEAFGACLDDSGNICVTGRSYGSGTYYDYATVKYDTAGGQRWAMRYNGPGNSHDEARAVCVDRYGNVIVTGRAYDNTTGDDFTTIKYAPDGAERWTRKYNGPGNGFDEARSIGCDSCGNIYVTGVSYGGSTDNDYCTVKYDTAGVQKWARRYNGPANSSDEAAAIRVSRAGEAFVTGSSWGAGTYYDYLTVKYDTAGVQQWAQRYDGPGNVPDNAYALAIDDAGNSYVTGRSYDSGGLDYDYATLKYNSSGTEQWSRRYNGPGNSYDEAYAIAADGSGNVLVAGRSVGAAGGEDYATLKYSPSGGLIWTGRYDGPAAGNDVANAVAVDGQGNIYVTGESYGIGSATDYATLKYSYTVALTEGFVGGGRSSPSAILRGPVHLKLGRDSKVFDAYGREAGPEDLTAGIYFIMTGRRPVRKIVVIK